MIKEKYMKTPRLFRVSSLLIIIGILYGGLLFFLAGFSGLDKVLKYMQYFFFLCISCGFFLQVVYVVRAAMGCYKDIKPARWKDQVC